MQSLALDTEMATRRIKGMVVGQIFTVSQAVRPGQVRRAFWSQGASSTQPPYKCGCSLPGQRGKGLLRLFHCMTNKFTGNALVPREQSSRALQASQQFLGKVMVANERRKV